MPREPDKLHSERMRLLVDFTASSFSHHPSPFGASVYETSSGKLVSQAYDTVLQESDPTKHGEINAISIATRNLQRISLSGCVLYSTCEPCPMCMSACIWAELDTIVFGASTMEDANRYWPQSSDVTPRELTDRMLLDSKCTLIPHIERQLCRELFRKCEEIRQNQNLNLPPHR
ncbi:MAG TPA: nucleoside deaminase [Xanthomonadales bacterium]|nr:nucleoside deaminase [Xanthomonadales bacterium]